MSSGPNARVRALQAMISDQRRMRAAVPFSGSRIGNSARLVGRRRSGRVRGRGGAVMRSRGPSRNARGQRIGRK